MQSGIQQGRLRYEECDQYYDGKTTAIKCQFEGMNDNVRNFEFSFKINNVLVTSFFFSAHKGFQETAVM